MNATVNAIPASTARELKSLAATVVAHGSCRRGCRQSCRSSCRRNCRR